MLAEGAPGDLFRPNGEITVLRTGIALGEENDSFKIIVVGFTG
jgi:hypothetical protein